MADQTKIQWTDSSWNPIVGCTRVSAGCEHCYAERLAATRLRHMPNYQGVASMTEAGPRWTGNVSLVRSKLDEPLRWRKRRLVFVNSMSDLFHEELGSYEIAAVFGAMAVAKLQTFQVLTKRSERMRAWFEWAAEPDRMHTSNPLARCLEAAANLSGPLLRRHIAGLSLSWPLPNVWLGVSAEDQATADQRIPLLLETPAAVRFVSAEPMLEPLDLSRWLRATTSMHVHASVEGMIKNRAFKGLCDNDGRPLTEAEAEDQLRMLRWQGVKLIPGNGCDNFDKDKGCLGHENPALSWVICGGESGPGYRPMDTDWARELRDQCAAAGVPLFMKQCAGKKPIPDDLMIREFPEEGDDA